MILERLKTETSDAHDRVEALAASDRIMNGSLTPEEYQQLILRNYVLHAAYEPMLDEAIARNGMDELNYAERKKLSFLERDLQEMGLAIPEVDFAPSFAAATPEEVFGSMYVMEGSTLGGSVIRRRLVSLPEFAGLPFHFYGCYGDRTGPMWNAFKTVVAERVQTADQEQATVNAAIKTFDDVARCFALDMASVR